MRDDVVIIDGCRTPFVKAFGPYSKFSAIDMGKHVIRELLAKTNLTPTLVEELIFSSVILNPRTPNAARELVLLSEFPNTIPAHFVSNNCISGLVGINMLVEAIRSKRISCGIAVGAESMSNPTLTYKREAEKAWLGLAKDKGVWKKLKHAAKAFWPKNVMPEAPSVKEPSTGLTMGEHCELMAQEWEIDRVSQDTLAWQSHTRATLARHAGIFNDEIVSFAGVTHDLTVRPKTSMDRLAKLKPVFDRTEKGTLTAGNSSPLTDGASAVLIMSRSQAEALGLTPKAVIGGSLWTGIRYSAIEPQDGLLMAPAIAVPKLLNEFGMKMEDVSRWEIHEAFAAQVLCNMKAWEKGWEKYGVDAIGTMSYDTVNVNGGSLALGHPFAATGGRLLLTLANNLEQGKFGCISICAAGAMAAAMAIQKC